MAAFLRKNCIAFGSLSPSKDSSKYENCSLDEKVFKLIELSVYTLESCNPKIRWNIEF